MTELSTVTLGWRADEGVRPYHALPKCKYGRSRLAYGGSPFAPALVSPSLEMTRQSSVTRGFSAGRKIYSKKTSRGKPFLIEIILAELLPDRSVLGEPPCFAESRTDKVDIDCTVTRYQTVAYVQKSDFACKLGKFVTVVLVVMNVYLCISENFIDRT